MTDNNALIAVFACRQGVEAAVKDITAQQDMSDGVDDGGFSSIVFANERGHILVKFYGEGGGVRT